MTKWLGPAAWGKKEAKGGDRLPYACHVDAATIRATTIETAVGTHRIAAASA